MKTKKFKDYLRKRGIDIISMSSILCPFADAKADGVEVLEVSKKEYSYLATYFCPDVYWTGKMIWGIRLKIKEKNG